MPKSKHKSRKVDDESDEEMPSQSQATQSHFQAEPDGYSSSDLDRKVNDLVQYLLLMEQKRMPVKRQDITKNVIKDSKSFPILIQRAKEKLAMVFGFELVEIENKKSYILVNNIDCECDNPHLEWTPEDNNKTGLLMVILSLIFMNENVLPGTLLWHTLKKMGIDPERHHEVFGDVKKLITQEFVRQGYIEYIRQPASDPPAYELKWGPRAKAETTKRNVLEFVCQIYSDEKGPMDLEKWRMQYADVVQSEGGVEDGSAEEG